MIAVFHHEFECALLDIVKGDFQAKDKATVFRPTNPCVETCAPI